QNDPADIPRLVEELDKGHDIVCGWRRVRKDRALTRLVPSKLANLMISFVTQVPIHDTGCSLKAYRGWVVRNLTLYSDMHRFIAALAVGVGARITELPVRHHPRRFGKSKYGLTRIFKVMVDLLTLKMLIQFSAHPIRWFCILALPALVVTLVLLFYALFRVDSTGFMFEPHYDILLISTAAVNLLVALNIFLLGLLAELQLNSSGYFRRRASMIRGEIVR
ncbi:MAG: glycosyltransferase, partial [Planctomycetes bacterium]|nr:glycosyltransferase [Planctomycetota bacterium]